MLKRIQRHHLFMWSYTRTLFRGLARPAFIFLSFLSITALFFAAAFLYLIDPVTNFGVSSFLDVLYFVVTTTTGVGYGDIVPHTSFGKIASMALMLLGTAIFVSFTATLASVIMELELKMGPKEDSESR